MAITRFSDDEHGNPMHPFVLFYRDFKCFFPLWIPHVNDIVAQYMEWASDVPAATWLRLQAEYTEHELRVKKAAA